MADNPCTALGIPAHLFQNSRREDSVFNPKEKIYRRFPEKDKAGNNNMLSNNLVSLSVFTTSKMSCNREKYSSDPKDVLYNIKSKEHFLNEGIVSLIVEEVEKLEFLHPDIKGLIFKLKLFHTPEQCMYPHSEVFAMENDKKVDKIKPSSIKMKIKRAYQQSCNILKKPEPK